MYAKEFESLNSNIDMGDSMSTTAPEFACSRHMSPVHGLNVNYRVNIISTRT